MTECVGLCSKVYCYKIDQVESSHNKAKGVSSRNLTIEDYKNVLLTRASLYGNRTMFRSKAHKITKHIKFFVAKLTKENVMLMKHNL